MALNSQRLLLQLGTTLLVEVSDLVLRHWYHWHLPMRIRAVGVNQTAVGCRLAVQYDILALFAGEVAHRILAHRLHIQALVAYLDHFVQIRQGLVLVHLSQAQFFDEELLDFLELADFLRRLGHFVVFVLHSHVVLLTILAFDQSLRLDFHALELALAGLDLVPLMPLAEILALLFTDPTLEQLLLLRNQNSLHAQRPLLLCNPFLPQILHVLLLLEPVDLLPPLELFDTLLLADQLLLHLALMPISRLQKLLSFLVGDVSQFLGTLLLEYQPLDAILQSVLLELAVPLHVAGLQHPDAVSDNLTSHAKAVVDNAQTAGGVTHALS